jgi:Holliday junction resolvase-like predicted endonuclease
MSKFGIWQTTESIPKRIPSSEIQFEQNLEDWIEADPEFIQPDLKIVGRQVGVDSGRIDLLAIDPQGRWIIIEIKRGTLRRDAIAQIIDYAACVQEMSPEELQAKVDQYLNRKNLSLEKLIGKKEAMNAFASDDRELLLFVVGTGRAPGLERITNYLADRYQLPITLGSFDVFQLPGGEYILVRELSESDTDSSTQSRYQPITAEEVCSLADGYGIGEEFRKIKRTAERIGLYVRSYKTSIMYTPPFQKNRMLYTVWAQPENESVKLYISPKAISEFYPISEEKATKILGESGYRFLQGEKVDEFNNTIIQLFKYFENES